MVAQYLRGLGIVRVSRWYGYTVWYWRIAFCRYWEPWPYN